MGDIRGDSALAENSGQRYERVQHRERAVVADPEIVIKRTATEIATLARDERHLWDMLDALRSAASERFKEKNRAKV